MKKTAKKAAETTTDTKGDTTMKKTAKKAAETTTDTKEDTTMKKTAKKAAETTTDTKEDTAMKKDTQVTPTANANEDATGSPAASTDATTTSSSAVALQLQVLEQTCGYGDPLPDAIRTASEGLARRVPSTIVDRIIALAVRGGGTVAGITFDPDAAKAALAEAEEADAVATAAQMLMRRAKDQSTRLRAGVAGGVSAIRTSMRGYAKTAQGAALAQENDVIRSLSKQHRAAGKGRTTRALNAAKAEVEEAGEAAPVTAAGTGGAEGAAGATAGVATPAVAPVVKGS